MEQKSRLPQKRPETKAAFYLLSVLTVIFSFLPVDLSDPADHVSEGESQPAGRVGEADRGEKQPEPATSDSYVRGLQSAAVSPKK